MGIAENKEAGMTWHEYFGWLWKDAQIRLVVLLLGLLGAGIYYLFNFIRKK